MSAGAIYAAHLSQVETWTSEALECARAQDQGFDGIVFHAGRPESYYADDLEIPFRPHAHFLRFADVAGPDHLLIFQPGRRLRLLRSVATDYWSAAPGDLSPWVFEAMEVEACNDVVASWSRDKPLGRWAFVGGGVDLAISLGFERDCIDPPAVVAALDWTRATKTEYEVACLREAQEIAGQGHAALRQGVLDGRSEFELHLAYLAATQQEEIDLPYPNIIAWDEASAVLHYQHRRRSAPSPGKSFLVDAGATVRGYASDITRTYCLADEVGAALEFRALLDGMEALQQRLAAEVAPGKRFVDLHRSAERYVAELLCEIGVIKTHADEARERGLVGTFFPHGLGHYLGLQVHDVGGRQASMNGGVEAPPADCPNLRTTRTLEPGHVVTIEPGLYFIPSLLERLRSNRNSAAVDWNRIDALAPFGGIRIEDDMLVTAAGGENLTRPFVPGHGDAAKAQGDSRAES